MYAGTSAAQGAAGWQLMRLQPREVLLTCSAARIHLLQLSLEPAARPAPHAGGDSGARNAGEGSDGGRDRGGGATSAIEVGLLARWHARRAQAAAAARSMAGAGTAAAAPPLPLLRWAHAAASFDAFRCDAEVRC